MHTFTNIINMADNNNTQDGSTTDDKSGPTTSPPHRSSSAAADNARRNRRQLASSAHISRNQIQGLLDGDGSVPCSDTTAAGYRHHSHVIRVPIRDEEEENRVPISIDVSTMTGEEIEEIRTTDPFLYYSIPESVRSISSQSTTTTSSTNNANVVPNNGRQVQRRRQSAPAVFADFPTSETQVRRSSRISFERSFDAEMSDFIESIVGLDVNDGGVDEFDEDGVDYESVGEEFDELLESIISSSYRPSKQGSSQ